MELIPALFASAILGLDEQQECSPELPELETAWQGVMITAPDEVRISHAEVEWVNNLIDATEAFKVPTDLDPENPFDRFRMAEGRRDDARILLASLLAELLNSKDYGSSDSLAEALNSQSIPAPNGDEWDAGMIVDELDTIGLTPPETDLDLLNGDFSEPDVEEIMGSDSSPDEALEAEETDSEMDVDDTTAIDEDTEVSQGEESTPADGDDSEEETKADGGPGEDLAVPVCLAFRFAADKSPITDVIHLRLIDSDKHVAMATVHLFPGEEEPLIMPDEPEDGDDYDEAFFEGWESFNLLDHIRLPLEPGAYTYTLQVMAEEAESNSHAITFTIY